MIDKSIRITASDRHALRIGIGNQSEIFADRCEIYDAFWKKNTLVIRMYIDTMHGSFDIGTLCVKKSKTVIDFQGTDRQEREHTAGNPDLMLY